MQTTAASCWPRSHSEVLNIIRSFGIEDPEVNVNFIYRNINVDGVYEKSLKGLRFSKWYNQQKISKETDLPTLVNDLVSLYSSVSKYKTPELEIGIKVLPELPPEEIALEEPIVRNGYPKRYERSTLDHMYILQHRITSIKRNRPPRRLKRYKA